MVNGPKTLRASNMLTRSGWIVSAFLILAFTLLRYTHTSAASLFQRSILVGSPTASDVTTHEVNFRTATNGSIGSIVFEYCSNLPFYGVPCTVPAGLVVNASSITTQTGITGLSISAPNSSANKLVLTRAAGVINANTVTKIVISNVTNQSGINETVYVRVSTHSTNNGTGTPIDFGAVVYSTVPGIGVGGYVPPHLTHCVGVFVAADCSSTTGALMNLGELSTTNARVSTSQFATATNDPTGYNTFVSGGTMTAGNEIIPALSGGGSSNPGTSQFGINLRGNSAPNGGSDKTGTGTGFVVTGYDTPNIFRYNDGERVASSSLPTEFNVFTVTYMVNISKAQRPGIYASSYTFTAVANF